MPLPNNMKKWQHYLPLLAFIVIGFFLWRGLSLHPRDLPSTLIDSPAPHFVLPSLLTKDHSVNQRVFKGHWTLLNVCASWCESCVEEHEFLMELKKRYPTLQLIGLDFQDAPGNARAWLKTHGNPYKVVLVDELGKVGVDYGVYGTPESFLIDPQGIIRAKVTGVLNDAMWQTHMANLLIQHASRGQAALAVKRGESPLPS